MTTLTQASQQHGVKDSHQKLAEMLPDGQAVPLKQIDPESVRKDLQDMLAKASGVALSQKKPN